MVFTVSRTTSFKVDLIWRGQVSITTVILINFSIVRRSHCETRASSRGPLGFFRFYHKSGISLNSIQKSTPYVHNRSLASPLVYLVIVMIMPDLFIFHVSPVVQSYNFLSVSVVLFVPLWAGNRPANLTLKMLVDNVHMRGFENWELNP